MTDKNTEQILKSVGNVLKQVKAELQAEIEAKADPTLRLYSSILYRNGVESREEVLGFCNGYLHKRSHVVRGDNPPAIFKRAMAGAS
jgi:hypothetical protein